MVQPEAEQDDPASATAARQASRSLTPHPDSATAPNATSSEPPATNPDKSRLFRAPSESAESVTSERKPATTEDTVGEGKKRGAVIDEVKVELRPAKIAKVTNEDTAQLASPAS